MGVEEKQVLLIKDSF